MNEQRASSADALMVKIHKQLGRLDDARKAVRRQQDELDRMVAEAVSSEPGSATWYLHRGDLTPDQVMGQASLTELQLDRLMGRYGSRFGSKKKARR